MRDSDQGKLIVFSAPSGSGKTTIVRHLLNQVELNLDFSISATSRPSRGKEVHGKDYYFISPEEFRKHIEKDEFVEWEEVYDGNFYGTLKSEIDRIWKTGRHVIFDVDVKGAINLKEYFKGDGLSIFIRVKSISELEQRLKERGTEDIESLKKRIEKVESEMEYQSSFENATEKMDAYDVEMLDEKSTIIEAH